MPKIKVGIMGGAGYTGSELIRLLVFHPMVELVFVHSKSKAGQKISDNLMDLVGDIDLIYTTTIQAEVDLVFLCMGHGESEALLMHTPFSKHVKIIDLSQDFRIQSSDSNFVYGLPELNRNTIKEASNIANPGCFATAIQLALLPLLQNNILESDVHIAATTGSTGAGQSLTDSSHFSWRQNNLSVYKPFSHQHLLEIKQSIKQLQSGFKNELIFIPQRGSFTRGIHATITLKIEHSIDVIIDMYNRYYDSHPFVFISNKEVDLKQVVNTNKCLLYLEKSGPHLMVVSIIDNLLKGASGQAVQNMNILFDWPETTGLKLKAMAF